MTPAEALTVAVDRYLDAYETWLRAEPVAKPAAHAARVRAGEVRREAQRALQQSTP